MVSRMQKHKSSCKNVPEVTNTIIYNLSGSSEDEKVMALAAIKRKITNSSQDGSIGEELSTFKIRKTIDEFDNQCARFIFATNSALKFVEHPEFIKYSEMLDPGYKPPNRKVIGGTLLDQVY